MNDSRDQIASFVAWLAWMAAQVGALAVFAFRVPLSARFPEPIEDAALVGVLVTQSVLAAAMGRGLLRDWRTYAFAISGGVPIAILATLLSGRPAGESVGVVVVLSLWLGVMAAAGAVRVDAVRAAGQAVLLLLTAGAPVMLYFAHEFGRRPVAADGVIAVVSPTLGAIAAAGKSFPLKSMVLPAALLLLAGVLALVRRRSKPATLATLTQAPGGK